jgi:hypothetical protein
LKQRTEARADTWIGVWPAGTGKVLGAYVRCYSENQWEVFEGFVLLNEKSNTVLEKLNKFCATPFCKALEFSSFLFEFE